MLISHRKQFIYTKTVKTAGTSVESYFEKYCLPEGEWEFSHARAMTVADSGVIGYRGKNPKGSEWFNHMSAASIRTRVGTEIWDQYLKFCVVRNPFDKLISAFYFFELSKDTNKESIENVIRKFRKWLALGNAESVIDRDKYLIDGEVCVDYFIRYENLNFGIWEICKRLSIPYEMERVPFLKVSDRNFRVGIADFYDTTSIDIVETAFAYELKNFDYGLLR